MTKGLRHRCNTPEDKLADFQRPDKASPIRGKLTDAVGHFSMRQVKVRPTASASRDGTTKSYRSRLRFFLPPHLDAGEMLGWALR